MFKKNNRWFLASILCLLPLSLGCTSQPPVTASEAARATSSEPNWVSLELTYNRNLEIEPCGCSIGPRGGLAREFNAVEKWRTSQQGLMAVSVGVTFVPQADDFKKKNRKYYLKKAEFLALALQDLGTAAVALSAEDMQWGRKPIQQWQAKVNYPFLSANIIDAKTKKPIFQPFTKVVKNGATIYFVALSHQKVQAPFKLPKDIEIASPKEALSETLNSLPTTDGFVVLLSSLTDAEQNEIEASFPDLHMILGGSKVTAVYGELIRKDLYVLTPFDRARTVSNIRLDLGKPFKKYFSEALHTNLIFEQAQIYKRGAELEAKLKETHPPDQQRALTAEFNILKNRLDVIQSIPEAADAESNQIEMTSPELDAAFEKPRNKLTDKVEKFKKSVRNLAVQEGND